MLMQQFQDMENAINNRHEMSCEFWLEMMSYAEARWRDAAPGSPERAEASRELQAISTIAMAK